MTLKKSLLAPLLLIACLAVLAVGGSPTHAQETENAEVSRMTAKELSATCKALSQNDTEGRHFFPVIGKVVEDSTYVRVKEGRGISDYTHTITLDTANWGIVSLYSFVMHGDYFNKTYKPIHRAYFNESIYLDNTLGICGYHNAKQTTMDRIDTLTIITEE